VDVGKRVDQRSLGVEDEAVEIKDEGVNHAANGTAMWVGQVTLVDARSLSAGASSRGQPKRPTTKRARRQSAMVLRPAGLFFAIAAGG
jgi:hypothetical protein